MFCELYLYAQRSYVESRRYVSRFHVVLCRLIVKPGITPTDQDRWMLFYIATQSDYYEVKQ